MPKATKKTKTPSSSVAKTDDGTVQITLHISWAKIDTKKGAVIASLAKEVDVPGFRKGKAPIDKAIAKISPDKIIEDTLNSLLPDAYTEAIKKHKITPAMFPKFDLISAQEGKDWQVRATTAQLPTINIKGYKEKIKNKSKSSNLSNKSTPEEKEQEIIRILLESFDTVPPRLLVENEVQSRLSSLLERLEKLGLELDSYLASVNKTSDGLRKEYTQQASASIKLDLLLGAISREEKIQVTDAEIEKFINAAGADKKLQQNLSSPEQKVVVRTVLKKRKILDSLLSLL